MFKGYTANRTSFSLVSVSAYQNVVSWCWSFLVTPPQSGSSESLHVSRRPGASFIKQRVKVVLNFIYDETAKCAYDQNIYTLFGSVKLRVHTAARYSP